MASNKIGHIRNLWNEYNLKWFGGALTEPTFRVTRALKYYGDFGVTESSGVPRLRISGKLCGDSRVLEDTLLHEMVHQYLWELGFPDWDSHGETFRNEAGRVGIEV